MRCKMSLSVLGGWKTVFARGCRGMANERPGVAREITPLAAFLLAMCLSPWLAGPSLAVPACPGGAEMAQPGGTVIRVYLRGDEFLHWTEDESGYTILLDAAKKAWVYATLDAGGQLTASDVVVGEQDPAALDLQKHLLAPAAVAGARLAAASRIPQVEGVEGPLGAPKIGTMKNLVLLVGFADKAFTRTVAEYQNLFNTVGYTTDGAQGSVKDYYKEVSYNQLNVDSVVVEPVTLTNSYVYYGGNDAYGDDSHPREMVREALAALEARGFDFSALDNDNDGWVDGLTVIHAGGGEEYSGNDANYIWSHQWAMASAVTYDGKSLQTYHTEPERRGWDSYSSTWGITRIGVICHENAHFLGLPDLYDYGYDSMGCGNFCLMAGGSWNGNYGTQPAQMSAWCKKYLTWLTPTVVTASGTYSLPRVEDNQTVYRLSGGFPSTQYFLIENRQGYGFDASMPGSTRGVLVWHVDETVANNNSQTHYKVDLEEASGTQHLELNTNSGDDADFFRSGTMTTFNYGTAPNSRSYSALGLGVDITNVSASSATMSVAILRQTVQFKASTYSVAEGAGTVRVYVSRIGSSGVLSVSYATAGGTAVSGSDFTSKSGTLSWTDGDAADKYVDVTITDDVICEGAETFTVTLSSPSGVGLGTPSSTVVTITDNDPQSMVLSASALSAAEGRTTNYTVRLAAQPTNSVVVSNAWLNGDSDLTVTAGSALTFTTSTWSTPQAVTVSAAEDNGDITNGAARFVVSAFGCTAVTVTVTEADDDFVLTLSANGNGTVSGGGIKDRDTPSFPITGTPGGGAAFLAWSGPDVASVSDRYSASTTVSVSNTASVTANFNTLPQIAQGSAVSVTMSEDGAPQPWSAPLITAADADNDTLTWAKVSGPGKGTATVSATGVSLTNLVYTPAANTNGPDSFVVQVSDGRGGSDAITVNVSITPVNDMPSFVGGTNQTVSASAGGQTVAGWASAIADGDPEATQALQFNVSTTSNALFSVQPAVSASGTLTYTPSPSVSGTATVNVTLTDDTTAGGGALTTPAQTFTITVTSWGSPGVSVSPVSLAVTEGVSASHYAVVLNAPPATNVLVCASFGEQLTVTPSNFTFSAVNWDVAQTAVVAAVDDAIGYGTRSVPVAHGTVSFDPNYNNIAISNVMVAITDNDPVGTDFVWSDSPASGDWNTTDINWAGAGIIWASAPTNNASFGASGRKEISAGAVTLSNMLFTADGYTIGGGPLLMHGEPTVGADLTATLTASVTNVGVWAKGGAGRLVLDPGTGASNSFYALKAANGTVQVASGTTLVTQPGSSPETGPAFWVSGGTLVVGGGVLKTTGGAYARVSEFGTLLVTNGLADLSGNTELLNGHNQPGVVTVSDAGVLDVRELRISQNQGEANLTAVNVNTGGVIRLNRFNLDTSNNFLRRGTVNFNGGMIVAKDNVNQLDMLGTTSTNWRGIAVNVLPGGAIINNNGCNITLRQNLTGSPDDGGLTKLNSGTLLLRGTNSYTGATVLQGGTLNIVSDLNLGAVPSSPATNVLFLSSSTLQGAGTCNLAANRAILITNSVTATFDTLSHTQTVCGTFVATDTNAVFAKVGSGMLILDPGPAAVSRFGTLKTTAGTLVIASGTNLVTCPNNGQNAPGLWVPGGTLLVAGGVLKTTAGKFVNVDGGHLLVTNGLVDATSCWEILNGIGNTGYGYTTVCGSGVILANAVRISQNPGNPSNTVVSVSTGGVLRLNNFKIDVAASQKGMLFLNGGTVEARTSTSNFLGTTEVFAGNDNDRWLTNIFVLVREGGAIINSLGNTIGIKQPLYTGAPGDGGLIKRGDGRLILLNTNTYNGVTSVEAGALELGRNDSLPAANTVNISSNAVFDLGSWTQVLAGLGGSGSVTNLSSLSVTTTVAPGDVGAFGTLTLASEPAALGGALCVGVSVNGACDRLHVNGSLDVSSLSLHLETPAQLNTSRRYVVVTCTGTLAGSFQTDDLPRRWRVRYDRASRQVILYFDPSTLLVIY